jgi:hypothetical protein
MVLTSHLNSAYFQKFMEQKSSLANQTSHEWRENDLNPRILMANTSFTEILAGDYDARWPLTVFQPFVSEFLPNIFDENVLMEYKSFLNEYKTTHNIHMASSIDIHQIVLDSKDYSQKIPEIQNFLNKNPHLKKFIEAKTKSNSWTKRQPRILLTLKSKNHRQILFNLLWHEPGRIQTKVDPLAEIPVGRSSNSRPRLAETMIILEKSQAAQNKTNFILNGFYPQLISYGLHGGKLIMLCLMRLYLNSSNVNKFVIDNPSLTAQDFYRILGFSEKQAWQQDRAGVENVLNKNSILFYPTKTKDTLNLD